VRSPPSAITADRCAVVNASATLFYVSDDVSEWVEELCQLPVRFRADGVSMRQLAEASAPDLTDDDRATALVRKRLGEEPALVEAWQTYSYDKRSSSGPYLDDREVGYFDAKRRDVVKRDDRFDARADFIVREAKSIPRNA
jgi:hypothetical protein